MSISFDSISEESISGQKTLEPLSLVPGGIILYPPQPQNLRTVVQKWPDESMPQVYEVTPAP